MFILLYVIDREVYFKPITYAVRDRKTRSLRLRRRRAELRLYYEEIRETKKGTNLQEVTPTKKIDTKAEKNMNII